MEAQEMVLGREKTGPRLTVFTGREAPRVLAGVWQGRLSGFTQATGLPCSVSSSPAARTGPARWW